jgi:hypothetical protein
VENDELHASLQRMEETIRTGNDTQHTTAEPHQVCSKTNRGQAVQWSPDDNRLIHTPIRREINQNTVESPDFHPRLGSHGTIICDWYGHDDTANPVNWTPLKKLYVVAVVAACSFVVYVSAPIWVPSEHAFRQEFGTEYEYTVLGLALFV